MHFCHRQTDRQTDTDIVAYARDVIYALYISRVCYDVSVRLSVRLLYRAYITSRAKKLQKKTVADHLLSGFRYATRRD